jgi:hypothetical protein
MVVAEDTSLLKDQLIRHRDKLLAGLGDLSPDLLEFAVQSRSCLG